MMITLANIRRRVSRRVNSRDLTHPDRGSKPTATFKSRYAAQTLVLLVLLCSSCFVSAISGQLPREVPVTVKGAVLDREHARIPDVKVHFVSRDKIFTALSDPDGEYSISVPQGKYEVTTERDGWYSVRRSRIHLARSGTVFLTVFPPPRSSVVSILSVGEDGDSSASAADIRPPRYMDLSVNGASPDMNGVVQYYSERTKRNSTIFKSAIFTYDAITIAADTLKVIDNKCLEAKGKVFFETANSRWRGSRLKGCFVDKEFRVLIKR